MYKAQHPSEIRHLPYFYSNFHTAVILLPILLATCNFTLYLQINSLIYGEARE